jgi:hypothetical protein
LFTITRLFALSLALTFSLEAAAFSLHSEKRSDGTTVLLLSNEPAPTQPPKLNEDPAIRTALVDFMGYATGSYTKDNYMIVSQVLDALDSKEKRGRIYFHYRK